MKCSSSAANFTFLLFLTLTLTFCHQRDETIRIGFVGALTGPYSGLGVNGRDGAILAVEEINRSGGLLGRPVELVARDDRQDPDTALRVDVELIRLGVIAIIGHMTSDMSMAALPLINQSETVMVSPTSASPLLGGYKDFFFRVFEPVDREIREAASWARLGDMALESLVIVYDIQNNSYCQDYAHRFEKEFKAAGGNVMCRMGMDTSDPSGALQVSQKIKELNPNGILIILNDIDTCFLLQHVRASGWGGKVFASPWSITNEFFEQAGPASEGLYAMVSVLPDHASQAYQEFRQSFLGRFRREPDFPAVHGYEAARVIFRAYERARSGGKALAEAILEIKEFDGLQSKISLDEFGDPRREKYRVVFKDKRLERIL